MVRETVDYSEMFLHLKYFGLKKGIKRQAVFSSVTKSSYHQVFYTCTPYLKGL